MGERIHPGRRRQIRRQSDRQRRIGNDEFRHHRRMEDHFLDGRGLVGNDRRAAGLGTGACRGRHGDHGSDAGHFGAAPIVAHVLEIPELSSLARKERHGLAGIQGAAVIGVPDENVGEVVKAFIVLDPAKQGQVTAEDIRTWAKDKITWYKIPTVIEFREELPTTMVGKVLRRVLKEEELAKGKRDEKRVG